jgi:hypothetical protein
VAAVEYGVAPERIWEAGIVKEASCHFLDCAVDSFGNSVLRWCVCIGFFMIDSLLNKVRLEFRGFVFASPSVQIKLTHSPVMVSARVM